MLSAVRRNLPQNRWDRQNYQAQLLETLTRPYTRLFNDFDRTYVYVVSKNKKHSKNVGPIHHCEPPHAHSPDVASGTVARRLLIDVHDNDDNDNAWQRGPLWPHGMGPIRRNTCSIKWLIDCALIAGTARQCSATTCANGGVCIQDWNSRMCDCDMTSFTGPTCQQGSWSQFQAVYFLFPSSFLRCRHERTIGDRT